MLTQDEIDKLINTMSSGIDVDPNAVQQSAVESKHYKLYNFRRPDKFSKDHLRGLQTIHENFCRSFGMVMTGYLRMQVEIQVVSVDQLTYDEFIRSMPSPMAINVVEFEPLEGQVLFSLGHEVTSSIIDRMLGGTGEAELKPRELTDIEQSLIRKVSERAFECLKDAWQDLQEIQPRPLRFEENFGLIQIAAPGEIVAMVTFEMKIGNQSSGLINLCIPFPVIESIIEQLSSQHIFSRGPEQVDPAVSDNILLRLRNAQMPIQVFLGGTQLSFEEMLALDVGDVVQLERQIKDPLVVCLNGEAKFMAVAGTRGNRLAVSLVDVVEDQESLKGFYFHG